MLKKLSTFALTGALTLGALSNFVGENFFSTDSKAAAAESYATLEVQKVFNREKAAYTAGTVGVYGEKPGTLVFKLSPTKNSDWEVGEDLNLMQRMVLGNGEFTPAKWIKQVNEEDNKSILVFVYVSEPNEAGGVDLITNNGQYGRDPITYEAQYWPGHDLTKNNSTPSVSPIKPKKVYWEGAELKPGQVGKINVIKPINLWKRSNEKLQYVRVLKPGELYRVYSYDTKFGGQYALGGGYYITKMDDYFQYKTPSKAKLVELNSK